jgi:modification methylase
LTTPQNDANSLVVSRFPPKFSAGTTNGNLKKRTTTRSFGTGSREGHDASPFYSRKICSARGLVAMPEALNQIPAHYLDGILTHSSEDMSELPDNSVSLMVTSPPYNVGKDYDVDMTLDEYLSFLKRVLAETYRVLVPGGRVAFNVANLGRKPYIPLNAHVSVIASEIGFLMRGEIIWIKGKGASGSCAWGSWMSATNPTLRDLHEYVLVFSKQRFDRPPAGLSTISREEFMSATTSVWHIPPESARRVGHPAPFPTALVERLIRLYTFRGDAVLDPFMGSGSTAVAAIQSDRRFVGYEIHPEYVSTCMERIAQVQEQLRSA